MYKIFSKTLSFPVLLTNFLC